MAFLYHRIPRNMRGNILYPLNELKNIYPDIFEEQIKKYKGREILLQQKIPQLDCFWNDVLHLSVVHPRVIDAIWTKHGLPFGLRTFVEITPEALEKEKTIVYLYKHEAVGEKYSEGNWAPYDPQSLDQYAVLPEEAIMYYEEEFAKEQEPFVWHRVPHIFYKGTIDILTQRVFEI